MAEEITLESLKLVNIKALALNKDKFGALTFDSSYPLLEKIRNFFVELDELNYQNNLTASEISSIENFKSQFVNYLRQLSSFDPGSDSSFSKNTHDNFENQIRGFNDSIMQTLRNSLIYLRQEATLKNKDEKELQKQQKAALQAEKEYKVLAEKLKQELGILKERKQEVEVVHGEVAAAIFGKHFESQSLEYSEKAEQWLKRRDRLFKWLMVIIITNLVFYVCLFTTNKVGYWPHLQPKEFFTLEYGVVKLTLLAILSYAVGFSSKNYSINSNLEVVNKHRKNVAETLTNFLNANAVQEVRSEILKAGADAMFKHSSAGYVSRREHKDDGPVREIINTVLSTKKE